MRSRGLRVTCLALAAVGLLSAGPRPSSTQSTPVTFAALFYEYRHRDGDRAVKILSTWTERQIDRDVKLPPDENDAWSKAALALLLVEASWSFTAYDKGEALIAEAYDSARASGDQRLLTFCRNWYFVGLTSHVKLSMDVEAELGRRFNEDPLAQLELGKKAERFLEVILHPDRDGYALGYRHDEIHGMSSHGAYGEDAARAEHAYRRALSLDPTLVEARVRLGHVLWFLDRRDEADRELTQAAREATSTHAPTLLYLANLFLGQLDEERGKLDAARERYEEAIRVYPSGQVARLALGRFLVATGREADGLSMLASALNSEAWDRQAPDPWRVYPLDDTGWYSGVRFAHLRSEVRRP